MGKLLDLLITDSDERIIDLKTLPPLGDAARTYVVITKKYATEDHLPYMVNLNKFTMRNKIL